MDQSVYCIPLGFGTCALSVQKIYFNLPVTKTIVYFLEPAPRKALKGRL
jgi:hypothetical protein